jgi:spermidine/putrescine transport system substrate-binding protein
MLWLKKLALLFCIMLLFTAFPMIGTVSVHAEQVDLKVYNWGEYISDGSEGTLDVIQEFENRNPGITVSYTTYATNEELYAKLRSGSAKYDVIIPSDYMVSRMIEEDMLEKLNFDNIPNFKNVMSDFINPDYDPTNEYSVPYTWGTVGIIYNTQMVDDPVDSWEILWNPKYTNQILMFNNSRDAFGIALKLLGYSQNTTDHAILDEAAEKLTEQKGILQAYVMDEIFDKMSNGEAALAPYYAGDALIMMEDNPDLAFAIPKEGTNKFVDAMVIPEGTEHKQEAEQFINFMLEDDIAYANINFIGYSTPMKTVKEMLDPEVLNDGVSYPSEEVLSNCESFINLPEETNVYMQELWVDILASGSSSVWELLFLFAVIIGLGSSVIIYLRKRNR